MNSENEHRETLIQFIRERRGNEAGFEELHEKLAQLIKEPGGEAYAKSLDEIEIKADEYIKAKGTGGTA